MDAVKTSWLAKRRQQKRCLHPHPHKAQLVDLGRNKMWWCLSCGKYLGQVITLFNWKWWPGQYQPRRYPSPDS